MFRDDVYSIDLSGAMGHEQRGKRFVVVVQSDLLFSSTAVVCPTSTRAHPFSYHPEVEVGGEATKVLCEHAQAVDMTRLRRQVGRLGITEMNAVSEALTFVLGLA